MLAFITRALSPDSDFERILHQAGWRVEGESLVQLTPLSVGQVPAADWWFFSSKHAVQFFLTGRNLPPLLRIGALGPGTAEAVERQIGRMPDFTGNGDPEATAKAFFTLAKKQKVLFPGAVHSLQSVQQLLEGQVEGMHISVYDNAAISDPPDMQHADALVFTSPLNVRAYCARYGVQGRQRVVAIGASTSRQLSALGIADVRVAAAPTEWALVERVLGG